MGHHKNEQILNKRMRLTFYAGGTIGWSVVLSILLYLCIVLLLGLLVYREMATSDVWMGLLLFLVGLLSALALARSLVTLRQNQTFWRSHKQQQYEINLLRMLVNPLIDVLDRARLHEEATRQLSTILGYDAVVLLTLEEPGEGASSAQSLLVHAASTTSTMLSWRLREPNKLTSICQAGEETTINWHIQGVAQFDTWMRQQRVSLITFFPLLYHGKKLGALGVARRSGSALSMSEASLLRLYAEQLAIFLEYARLYEEAHEHQAFAQALANIATRLNTAAIELGEMNQLICDEGGHALDADYTIFYLPDEKREKLVPQTFWDKEQERVVPSTTWPELSVQESDGQTFFDLQARLVHLERADAVSVCKLSPTHADVIPPDEAACSSAQQGTLRDALRRRGVNSAILVPMMAEGEPIGLLVFARIQSAGRQRRAFSVFDLPHAQDFSEQAAVAFTNARLYERLRNAHRRLQELDQMKDQFMMTASHELRTPLTAVQGYIELVAQYGNVLPPEEQGDFLEKARRGCDELAMLLSNIMDASRLERDVIIRPALLKGVSVSEAFESVTLMIEPNLTREKRELSVEVEDNLSVQADPMRLRQVLLNVCVNALKYSEPGTPLHLSASASQVHEPVVRIDVTDRGKGIAPEDQERVFQRFYRLEGDVNSPVRGSGLGLYISRRLIEAMGGKIWITSSGVPSEGSTFTIQLPMA